MGKNPASSTPQHIRTSIVKQWPVWPRRRMPQIPLCGLRTRQWECPVEYTPAKTSFFFLNRIPSHPRGLYFNNPFSVSFNLIYMLSLFLHIFICWPPAAKHRCNLSPHRSSLQDFIVFSNHFYWLAVLISILKLIWPIMKSYFIKYTVIL